MGQLFIKPEIDFNQLPFIGRWIEAKYSNVKTLKQLVRFIHHCWDEADISANQVRAEAYKRVGNALYGCVTKRTYESSLKIEL